MNPHRFYVLLSATLAGAACTAPESAGEPDVGAVEQELTATSCDESDAYNTDANTCDGGWTFEPRCTRAHEDCGPSYEVCEPQDYGTCMAYESHSTREVVYAKSSSGSCEIPLYGGPNYSWAPHGWLRLPRDQVDMGKIFSLPAPYRWGWFDIEMWDGVVLVDHVRADGWVCKARIQVVARRRASAACPCTKKTTRYPVCERPAAECSPSGNADWGYAGSWVQRWQINQVKATDSEPTCLTCEDISLDDASAKVDCLTRNLGNAMSTATTRAILEPNTDRAGSDYRSFTSYTGPSACVVACNNESQCKATTYVESNKKCWLKSGIPSSRWASGMVSYAKRPGTGWAQGSAGPIIEQLKLVLELKGDELSESQRAAIRPYYVSHPTTNASCTASAPISSSHPALLALTGAGGVSLAYCEAMNQSHVPPELRARELRRCSELLALVADNASSQPDLVRDVGDLLTNLYIGQLDVVSGNTPYAALPFQLTLLQDWLIWWEHIADRAGRLDERDAALEVTTAAMWAAFHDKESPATTLLSDLGATGIGGDAQAELLAEFGEDAQSVGAQVVAAAARPQAGPSADGLALSRYPVTPLLLAELLGDATRELVGELAPLSAYHDVACAVIQSCRAAPADSPLAGYWSALAAMDDETALEAAIDLHGAGLKAWEAAFEALANNHDRVRIAIDEARATNSRAGLEAILATAAQRSRAFDATGVFDPQALRTLAVGMDRADRSRILAAVTAAEAELAQGLAAYESGILDLLHAGMSNLEGTHMVERLDADRAQQLLEYDQIQQRIGGLQAATDAAERAFGTIAEAWRRIDHTVDGGRLVQVGPAQLDIVVPSHAGRFVPEIDQTVEQLAVSSNFVEAGIAAGSILSVNAAGRYAQSCAIESTLAMNPHGGGPLNINAAECGPEGYQLTVSDGRYNAVSSSSEDRTSANLTVGLRGEACMTSGIYGEVSGLEAKACAYTDASASWTESNIDTDVYGGETRTHASFARGLRLHRVTPFPSAAAGALLVVLVDAEERVYDIQPIRGGANAVLVRRPNTTAYFVVNDLGTCGGSSAAPSNLTIGWRVLQSEGTVAAAMIGSMQAVLDYFAAGVNSFVAQGVVTGTQQAELRQWAQLELRASLDGVGEVPEPARALFDAFVDKELAHLERRVQIMVLERELEVRRHQLATADLQRRQAESSNSVRRLLSRRVVQHMDTALLRDHAKNTIELVHTELLPVLRLWYPTALEQLRSSPAFHQLRSVDIGMSTYALSQMLQRSIDDFMDEYDTASRRDERPAAVEPAFKAVAFPRPGFGPVDDGLGGGFGGGLDPLAIGQLMPIADMARSQAVWDAIEARDWGLFRVRVEDLYGHGDGRLNCYSNVPVVENVALFVIRPYASDNHALNGQFREFDVEASSEQPFPTADGWQSFQLRDGIWTRYEIPVFYSNPFDVLSTITQNPRMSAQPPVGLSVFGDIEIDFSELAAIEGVGGHTGIDDATAVVLAYRLGWRPGERLNWVETCRL